MEENPKYGGDALQQKKEEKEGEKCAVKAHSGLTCIVKSYLEENRKRIKQEDKAVLALDQVLRKPWSKLSQFWTLTHWSRKEHLGRAEIMDLTYFAGYIDPVRGSLGFL
jgi:hypothetical protein